MPKQDEQKDDFNYPRDLKPPATTPVYDAVKSSMAKHGIPDPFVTREAKRYKLEAEAWREAWRVLAYCGAGNSEIGRILTQMLDSVHDKLRAAGYEPNGAPEK